MNQVHLIGVDLGTSVVKATLFDDASAVLADATQEITLDQPSPGAAEQSGDEFFHCALNCIRAVIEQAGVEASTVAGIGFAGQMGGAIGIDAEWNAVTPWYPSTLDTRHLPHLNHMRDAMGDRLIEIAGTLPIAAPRLLWWRKEYPLLYQRIEKVMILANYVAGRMAGLRSDDAFIDSSYLTWMGLADTAKRTWSSELIERFNVPASKLPRIVPAATVIGHLTSEAAQWCGLLQGTPLVAGAGDTVSGFIGAGLVNSGQLMDVSGTFLVFATCLNNYIADVKHGVLQSLAGPLGDDNWYAMTYISGGGLTHRWFSDQFGAEEQTHALQQGTSAYALLDEEATHIDAGANGLMFIPHLAGRACPSDPDIRGAWLGFTWTHRKAHFYRALLESIAYDYANTLDIVREYCPQQTFDEVRVIGGGANSALWNQIKADVLGVPYVTLQCDNAATLGCALIAGHAIGLYPDLRSTALQLTKASQQFDVDRQKHAVYQHYAQVYRGMFDQLRPAYGALQQAQRNSM